MPRALIVTSQAPVAKQIGVTLALTTTEVIMAEAPGYTVPLLGFNAGTRTARGVVEFSSPLLVSNVTTVSATFTARIIRITPAGTFVVANAITVEPADTVIFPMNGQFLLRETTEIAGDYLDIKASANASLVATLSFTEGQAEEDDVT
jgi:hypothetical protein